ncbi:unnamed protein product [Calicophoron daubneyi]|uniref:Uncharacterized protein n=1 Tax=Calicophoron daubneyi TaxID=300641 RepID=A0AAV2T5Q3_CALDB
MVGSGKLLAIIFGFSYFVMAVSSICQLSQQHARYENNITTIFKEILGFREAEKVFDAALAEVKALPEKIIRVNNISLGKQLNEMDIRSRELLIYAAKFLESLRELFHERQMKSVPRSVLRLNSELDYLMMAVLRDGSLPQKLGYSMEDLIQCLRSKELVSHTMDLFGPLRIKWQEQFVIGLKQYVYLQHITERIRLDLTRKPSESCVRGLNKLVIGCPHNAMQINHPPVDPDQRPSNGFRLQSGICGSFCSNVIRACLAEPFLLLSDGGRNDRIASKERDELIPWELFAEVQGAQKSQKSYVISTYEAVLTALNASYISELIRTGLKNTRMKKASLKPVLHIFCGQPGHPEKQLPRTVNTSDSAVGVNSFPKQTVTEDIAREQNKLTNKVKELSRQLSVLASKHLAPELFVRNVEKRFCNEDSYDKRGNQIACWNGMMFGRNAAIPDRLGPSCPNKC